MGSPVFRRLRNNENPVDPNCAQGTLLWPMVITALLQEALWGSAQGPHPHLTRSPRSDLYDTGDVCEFDVNEYI